LGCRANQEELLSIGVQDHFLPNGYSELFAVMTKAHANHCRLVGFQHGSTNDSFDRSNAVAVEARSPHESVDAIQQAVQRHRR
jgi:hypothetical protein